MQFFVGLFCFGGVTFIDFAYFSLIMHYTFYHISHNSGRCFLSQIKTKTELKTVKHTPV
jgi:hypothetical protein